MIPVLAAYESIELDEIIPLFFFITLSIGYFALRRWKEGKELIKTLKEMATLDPLTTLFNRRKIETELARSIKYSERFKQALSIVIIDIDHFKQVNDKHGHDIGDVVLIEFSNLLTLHCRDTDIVGRWGGEEFIIVAPQTNIFETYDLAERIRSHVEKHLFPEVNSITCSLGIAAYRADHQIEDTIRRADKALYQAKNEGRNKVQTFEEEE